MECYKNLKKWCFENGLKSKNIDFPVAFGPIGYTGIAAKEYI